MRAVLVLVCCTAALPLAGCGGGGSNDSAGTTAGSGDSAQQTVSIAERDFSLEPSTANVGRPGTVTFRVTNDGQTTHALEVEGNGVEEKTDSIQAGDSKSLTIQLSKPGRYEFYCPIDGHRGKGMEGELRVGGSSGTGTTPTPGATTESGTTTDSSGY